MGRIGNLVKQLKFSPRQFTFVLGELSHGVVLARRVPRQELGLDDGVLDMAHLSPISWSSP